MSLYTVKRLHIYILGEPPIYTYGISRMELLSGDED